MCSSSNYVLETNQLTKHYGEQISVNKLDIHLQKGRIYGLLGKNGAGKSTTMKMILNLIKPTSGEISIFGKRLNDASKSDIKNIYSKIGNMIESPGFYPNLTGTENLRIFARLRGINDSKIEEVLKKVNLPYKDKKVFSEYSLGMKQRLGIANALMHSPEILILDEPINGLDPDGIIEVRNLLLDLSKNHGTTILISSHILSEIQLIADDIGIIANGVLLMEAPLKTLIENNSDTFIFKVSDVSKAMAILQKDFGIVGEKKDTEELWINQYNFQPDEVIKAFVNAHIRVLSAFLREGTLENYFEALTNEVSK